MQENRSIAPGLGAFRLTLQSRENGFCGYVYSAALGCRAEFTSLARLIVLLEEWMNTATDSPVPEKPSAAAAPADVELLNRCSNYPRLEKKAIYQAIRITTE